ncbi:MAG: ferritin-like domain-containing protein [Gemmatimonadales bacterium]|nr:MAG: ferritin-like domain-containing protein [Gemmatimonadales bacterium]
MPSLDLEPEITERLTSRRDALRGAGVWGLGAALASLPLGLGVLAKSAFAQQGIPQQVQDILNFALTLEYLEAEYYTLGMAAPGLIPAAHRPIFDLIRVHEVQHVELLQSVLGGAAVAKPEFDFTAGGAFAPFTDYAQFQVLAQAFEDTGVRAYKGGAAGLAVAPDLLDAGLQIHSVEARHASEVRALRGQSRWIQFADTDVAAIAAVYAGEDNTTHAGIDVTGITNVGPLGVTEAWDEPLGVPEVLEIAGLFIVS